MRLAGELEDYDVPIGPDLEAFNQIKLTDAQSSRPLHDGEFGVGAAVKGGV